MNTVIGVFDDPVAARRAMERLRDGPLMLDDISIISRNAEASGANSEDVSAGEGAAVGAVWGGLVGLGALLVPGIGPFVAGGALFAALTGAVTGAVVGGVSAALIDFSGIPQEDARGYETEVNNGKTLVAVRARDEDTAEVHRLLSADGASDVRDDIHEAGAAATVGAPPRIAMSNSMRRPAGGPVAKLLAKARAAARAPTPASMTPISGWARARGRAKRRATPGPAGSSFPTPTRPRRARTPASTSRTSGLARAKATSQSANLA